MNTATRPHFGPPSHEASLISLFSTAHEFTLYPVLFAYSFTLYPIPSRVQRHPVPPRQQHHSRRHQGVNGLGHDMYRVTDKALLFYQDGHLFFQAVFIFYPQNVAIGECSAGRLPHPPTPHTRPEPTPFCNYCRRRMCCWPTALRTGGATSPRSLVSVKVWRQHGSVDIGRKCSHVEYECVPCRVEVQKVWALGEIWRGMRDLLCVWEVLCCMPAWPISHPTH